MLQLNLLPDVKKEFIQAQRTRNSVIAMCVTASVVAIGILAILGAVIGAQALRKNVVTSDIEKNAATIKNTPEINKYLTVQNQLSQIDQLKEDEPVYSRLFGYLQKLNPPAPNNVELTQVKILGADSGMTDAIELQGSTGNFASLDVYKTTLQSATISYTDANGDQQNNQPLFTNVAIKEAAISRSSGDGRVNFTINATYDPAAFNRTNKNVVLNVPNIVTSDADRNAPKQVFGNNNTSGDGQ